MDLTFGSLTSLKAAILPESLRARTEWDSVLAAMARGVAASFEEHCRREFIRLENATFAFTADCSQVSLPRFPVETIISVERRDSLSDGWQDLGLASIYNLSEASGLVEFGSVLGGHLSRCRITYTGGYWVDVSENGSGTLPAGATPLPFDLVSAWHLQCHHEVDRRDLIRNAAAKKESDAALPSVSKLELVPRVAEILQPFRRL